MDYRHQAEDDARYACTDCGARNATDGDCGTCGEGPVVDLDEPEVRETLRKDDETRAEAHRQRLRRAAIPTGIVVGILLGAATPTLLPIPFGNVIQTVLLMVLAAFGAQWGLVAAMPPKARFPYLETAATASIRGSAAAMKRAEARKPLLLLGGLVLLGLALGGFALVQRTLSANAFEERRAAASQAWADLQQCAIGAPIVDSAQLHRRLRLAQLAGDQGDWPERCTPHVTALYEQLEPGKRGFGATLRSELEARFECQAECAITNLADQLTELELVVAPLMALRVSDLEAETSPIRTSTVPGPKLAEGTLLAGDAFSSLDEPDAKIQDREQLPDGRVRLLLNSYRSGLALCELTPGDPGAPCDRLRLPVTASTVSLVGGAEDAAVVGQANSHSDPTTYGRDGEAVTLWAGRRQGFSLFRKSSRVWRLDRVVDGESDAHKKLKMPESGSDPWLAADHVMWTAADDDDVTQLYARPLQTEGKVTGDKLTLGASPEARAPQVCTAGGTTAVLLGTSARNYRVAMHDGTSWSFPEGASAAPPPAPKPIAKKPLDADDEEAAARRAALRDAAEFGMIGLLNSGAGSDPWASSAPMGRSGLFGLSGSNKPKRTRRAKDDDDDERPPTPSATRRRAVPQRSLVCGEGEAFVTWRESSADRIHEMRCTPDGCEANAIQLPLAAKSMWTATRLGEGTLLLWQARGGELRMRHAPLAKLPETTDRLVMDDQKHGGPGTLDLEAFATRQGVVFLFRGLGLHGLTFSPDGTFAPLR